MYEIAAIACAAAFAAAWFAGARRGRCRNSVFSAMLMFAGASAMWGVDCAANAIEGGEAFDFSGDAALLAAAVVAAGLAVFGVSAALEYARSGSRT